MDEYSAVAFTEEDHEEPPSPAETIEDGDDSRQGDSPTSVSGLKSLFSAGAANVASRVEENVKGHNTNLSLQDRLLARLLQQTLPKSDENDETETGESSETHVRPPFSIPAMANNFRRFNARVGILFRLQDEILKLLSWKYKTQTWSFMFIYSFICLDPYLLVVMPFVAVLLFIMIPAFLARHPPPPPSTSTSSTTPYYSYGGPALAPPKIIKPVSETSKDFFHNMRDLQNSMADFASLYDSSLALITPPTNFSNESLSSSLFILFTAFAAILFLTAHLISWRFVALLAGNILFLSQHPKAGPSAEAFCEVLESHRSSNSSRERNKEERAAGFTLFGYSIPLTPAGIMKLLDYLTAISLSVEPEELEVEIFELQHKNYSPYSAVAEWEPFLFTNTPYDPLSPARISGDRPKGSRFFEDVQAPPGWTWRSKKWELDLECREWVMERMVTGVEFEIPDANDDGISGEAGGWVWDLPFNPPKHAMGDTDINVETDSSSPSTEKPQPEDVKPEWEEATQQADRSGDWRRRRWVRVVQRAEVGAKAS